MANTVEILVKARDEASRVLTRVGKEADSLSDKLRRMRLPLLAVTGAFAALGVSSVKAASDLVEATNKANVTFGASAKIVQDFAKTSADQFGLSARAANEYAGTLGTILNASGLATDASAEMSVGLVKLAADLASFNNIPIGEALLKIQSGLVGEVEPLRRVGVLLSQVAVDAKAMELGLVGASGVLSEAAKVQARYALILEQTANQQGDFSRTSGDMANAIRRAQAQFEDVRASLGTQLIPIVTTVIGKVNDLLRSLTNLSPEARTVILVMGGLVGSLAAVGIILPSIIGGFGILRTVIGSTSARLLLMIAGFELLAQGTAALMESIGAAAPGARVTPFSILGKVVDQLFSEMDKAVGGADDLAASLDDLARQSQEANDGIDALKNATAGFQKVTTNFGALQKTLAALGAPTSEATAQFQVLRDAGLGVAAAWDTISALYDSELRGTIEDFASRIEGGANALKLAQLSNLSLIDTLKLLQAVAEGLTLPDVLMAGADAAAAAAAEVARLNAEMRALGPGGAIAAGLGPGANLGDITSEFRAEHDITSPPSNRNPGPFPANPRSEGTSSEIHIHVDLDGKEIAHIVNDGLGDEARIDEQVRSN